MIDFAKLLNPKKKIAGLDIGNSYIKVMEFEGDSMGDAKLLNYWVEPIPANIINDGQLSNIESLGKILKSVWKKAGITTKDVAIALPNANVIYKKVISPVFDEDEAMKIQMDSHMREHLGGGLTMDQIKMDYAVLSENKISQGEYNIMLVGARSESVEDRVAIVEYAGLNPVIIDVEQYAYQNMLRLIKSEDFLEKNYLLLDCSASVMRMMVFQKGEFVGERSTQIGGSTLTRDILMNQPDITIEEAERIKVRREGDEAYEIVERTFLNNYVLEFLSMFQFFISSTPLDIDEIILTGGTANIPGIEDVFKKALQNHSETNIKSEPYVAKPLADIAKSDKIDLRNLEKEQAGLFLVTSLAIRQFLRQY